MEFPNLEISISISKNVRMRVLILSVAAFYTFEHLNRMVYDALGLFHNQNLKKWINFLPIRSETDNSR